MNKDHVTVIERYQRGGVVAYSVDEGETYHPTVRQAFEHQFEVNDLASNNSKPTQTHTKSAQLHPSKTNDGGRNGD